MAEKENATVMEAIDESVPELKDRLARLTDQLIDVKKQKKAATAGFNEEIKDLEEMIAAIIAQIKQKEANSAPTLLG